MSIYDAVAAALPGFRAQAESLMVDACIIWRETGALDPVTFEPIQTQVYAGKAKVQTYEGNEQTKDVGGGVAVVQDYKVHVPVGAYVPAVNDVVEITAAAHDPALVGRRFVVRGPLNKTLATAYRLRVTDLNGFGEA